MNAKPNVIYILGDDHRAEQLGFKDHPIAETPNLDALAQDGVHFTTNHHSLPKEILGARS